MAEPLAAAAEVVSGIGSLRVNSSSQGSCIFYISLQSMDENVLTLQKYVFYEAVFFVKVY